uniref:Mur ligase family protein n=1 Tax=Ningiella ruwaisensis TaxID=2364274 RepID=UPI001445EB9C|nr:UDP-N-acetylmuramoyl-L-alanyl-D-glutamate--2,6-diaminopimelate ligase [Ningiella ruwaisensis]
MPLAETIDASPLNQPMFSGTVLMSLLNKYVQQNIVMACISGPDAETQLAKVSRLSLDSRTANANTAFVAMKGLQTDGHLFIESAIANGCKLVLCEKSPSLAIQALVVRENASVFVFEDLKSSLPHILQDLFIQERANNAKAEQTLITAVTGTNGKTSVAWFYAQLQALLTGKSASLGTLGLSVFSLDTTFKAETAENNASEAIQTHQRSDAQILSEKTTPLGVNTSPDLISQFACLSFLQKQNVKRYCIEASSHGIDQGRLSCLPIDTAIFTNLTQDHLDYHKDMQRYAAAKRALLTIHSRGFSRPLEINKVVLNADDPESLNWAGQVSANQQLVWYGLQLEAIPDNAERYCVAMNIQYLSTGLSFDVKSSWGDSHVSLVLYGKFNVSNLLAAMSALLMQGADFARLSQLVERLKGVPGRMEIFAPVLSKPDFEQESSSPAKDKQAGEAIQTFNTRNKGTLIVDYAHTPDALSQALKAARQHAKGKLFCVFGCGGDRDRSKRPIMGKVASKLADMLVITEDNSRNEAPEDIIKDILSGIEFNCPHHIEVTREKAVRWAFEQSKKDDLILLAGKGHEDYLEINNKRIAYSERALARQLTDQFSTQSLKDNKQKRIQPEEQQYD